MRLRPPRDGRRRLRRVRLLHGGAYLRLMDRRADDGVRHVFASSTEARICGTELRRELQESELGVFASSTEARICGQAMHSPATHRMIAVFASSTEARICGNTASTAPTDCSRCSPPPRRRVFAANRSTLVHAGRQDVFASSTEARICGSYGLRQVPAPAAGVRLLHGGAYLRRIAREDISGERGKCSPPPRRRVFAARSWRANTRERPACSPPPRRRVFAAGPTRR